MNRPAHNSRSDTASPANRWSIVVAAGLILFMVQLDAFTVATVMPVITDDLQTTPAIAQWAMLGFTLPAIALVIPVGGWLGRVGRRPALLMSVAGFAATGVLVAAAPGVEWLITGRVLQGAFAAITFVLMPLIAAEAVAPALRGRAMGLVFALGPIGGITGPLLGGLLAEQFGWRAAFLLNLPVAVAVLVLGRRMPRTLPLRGPSKSTLVETVYLLIAFTPLLIALTLAVELHPAWLALALLGVVGFVKCLRTGSGAEVRQMMRIKAARGSLWALWAQTAVQGTLLMLVPFFLARELALPAAKLGIPTMVMAATTAATSFVAGWLTDRWGAARTTFVGLAFIALATVNLLPLNPEWTMFDLLWRIGLVGVGVGLFGGAQTAMTLEATPERLAATASGAMSLFRQTAIAAAPSLATLGWGLSGYSLDGMRLVLIAAAAIGFLGLIPLLTPTTKKSNRELIPAA
ncbi:MFS transporter [Glycomyces sp. NPDC046736]|uniref:MFS transporter n=1 Tax=Glycomyces sp. NPDC046736 TaxID=3155615 RepID=UPI0033D29AB5